MVFGVRGHCGQRAQLAAARGLGRGSGLATVHLLKMAVNLVAAPRNKLVTAATDPAQLMVITPSGQTGLYATKLVERES